MKKLLLIALLAFGMNARAQITLEHIYDSASTYNNNSVGVPNQLMIINFTVSGEKYVKLNREGKAIEIYNLNHSFFKSISYAGFPQDFYNNPTIFYLSENLFSTDSKVDFMYIYRDDHLYDYTKIYNEDGILIFQADSMGPVVNPTWAMQQWPIYNTTQGTKMILSHQKNAQAKVYSLPGTLTANIQDANNNLIAAQSQSIVSNPYPNPSSTSTRIDYSFPDGVSEGEIVFYDIAGNEVKRFKVDKTFSTLLVSTADISVGTYYYQLQTTAQSSEGKKMVVIK
jgi:hypothetical protein